MLGLLRLAEAEQRGGQGGAQRPRRLRRQDHGVEGTAEQLGGQLRDPDGQFVRGAGQPGQQRCRDGPATASRARPASRASSASRPTSACRITFGTWPVPVIPAVWPQHGLRRNNGQRGANAAVE